jgi:hypothetical protein
LIDKTELPEELKKTREIKLNEQTFFAPPWWRHEVSEEVKHKRRDEIKATRLYLYKAERSRRNVEWRPPDDYYHSSGSFKNGTSSLKNVKKAFANISTYKGKPPLSCILDDPRQKIKSRKVYIPWHDVTKLTRDYPAHSLVLQSFNKALVILNQNRELLDRLVVELLYQEILRQPEVEKILKEFDMEKAITGDTNSILL